VTAKIQTTIFLRERRRRVPLSFSDRESIDDGLYVAQESVHDAFPTKDEKPIRKGKCDSQKAKMDENGSPRPNLPSVYSNFLEVEDSAVHAGAEKLDENADAGSAFEGFNSQEPDSKDSVNIKLSAVVSNLETNKALLATKPRTQETGFPSE
jgi:hypothetical protein